MKRTHKQLALTLALALLAGCQTGYRGGVTRVDPETITDVNSRWNDTDARQVVHALSEDCLSRPWIDNWMKANNGDYPIVFLGNVRNDTEEYIETDLFTNWMQEVFVNSGRIRIKSERDQRAELREERLDTEFNDPATVKARAKELNADFALVGQVLQNRQQSPDGRKRVNFYQVNMRLINVETAEVVWIRTKEIKKIGE